MARGTGAFCSLWHRWKDKSSWSPKCHPMAGDGMRGAAGGTGCALPMLLAACPCRAAGHSTPVSSLSADRGKIPPSPPSTLCVFVPRIFLIALAWLTK